MKGYKTVIFNVIMAFLSFLSIVAPGSEIPGAAEITGLLDQAEAFIVAAWGVGNVILRSVTNTAMFKKD